LYTTADASKSDEELVAMTKNWTIVGKDLLRLVSCKEPYEWKDPTQDEWEFNEGAKTAAAGKKFKVRTAPGAGINFRGLVGT
jgi:carbamoyl-phosphate synthase small subunit